MRLLIDDIYIYNEFEYVRQFILTAKSHVEHCSIC